MPNLFDYISWRGDLGFTQSPLNPVDYVIFSQLAYLPFDSIVPGPGEKEGISIHLALETLKKRVQSRKPQQNSVIGFKENPAFINALVLSNRFRNCHILGYVNQIDDEREIQFSALCIDTGDGSYSIVYRGTDASFIGWKEDFNMAFRETVPSQKEAIKYFEKIASMVKGQLRIGGHSKGGNLAVYAAAFCQKKVQERITDIFNFDAPGFSDIIFASDGFSAIKDRIHCYVPQASVIGMILEQGCDYNVIKSSENGLMQHSLFSWEVTYNNMIHVKETTQGSRFINKTLREWIGSLNNEQREKFIDGLYSILYTSEIKTINELESSWFISLGKLIKSLGNIDEPTRKLIRDTFAELFRSASRNLDSLWKPK
jgi:hypothetical protein